MTFTPRKVDYSNIVGLSDSYKYSHPRLYPPKTQTIYSYLESRGGLYETTVFFGLQYMLVQYLMDGVTQEKIERIAPRAAQHFFGNNNVFYRKGWEYIANQHNGKLPISIKAVPEGTVVPVKNVLMTCENTDSECWWLTNFLETVLMEVWSTITVATQSREMKKDILRYLELSGTPSLIPYKLHDFGMRGVSSIETAAWSGSAHLVNFRGTDTFIATELINAIYGDFMAGESIPATEHSTITAWGRLREASACENVLDEFKEGFVACVSDSYDFFDLCRNVWGKKLKHKIINRNGVLIARPDSGNPCQVVPEGLRILGANLGQYQNDKGYTVLNDHIRMIQGDGVDRVSSPEIMQAVVDAGYSMDNLAFGSGGALLQKLNRDTQKMAFKASSAVVDGEEIDVYKDPITDPGKVSKKGRLALVKRDGEFTTISEKECIANNEENHLVEVFRNGELTKWYHFDEIRERAKVNGY